MKEKSNLFIKEHKHTNALHIVRKDKPNNKQTIKNTTIKNNHNITILQKSM